MDEWSVKSSGENHEDNALITEWKVIKNCFTKSTKNMDVIFWGGKLEQLFLCLNILNTIAFLYIKG